MTAGERNVWDHLEALHSGDLALDEFEQWLYASKEAEVVLGADEWLEFIERDYRKRCAHQDTCGQIERSYEERRPGQLPFDRARRVATEFLEHRRDLWSTSQVLASLYRQGYGLIPLAFVSIASLLDDILQSVDMGRKRAVLACKKAGRT